MIHTYLDGSIETVCKSYICPRCGKANSVNAPVVVGDRVEMGGCENCFDDCSEQIKHDYFISLR